MTRSHGRGRSPGPTRPADIDAGLVRRLVDSQFPGWSHLPIRPVDAGGHDNRTFRLGDQLTVRLPSAGPYVPAVEKEQHWLPILAPQLPLPIPEPVARGVPGHGYPFPWSVYRWIAGRPVDSAAGTDLPAFASELAQFLRALQRVDPAGGPAPGAHNFHRGGPLTTYADQTVQAIDVLGAEIPRDRVRAVWDRALGATWTGAPVWLHGDVAAGNLLVDGGRLAAVIDFGTCGVGDPACDAVIAWTLLSGPSRAAFRDGLEFDPGTWARARGWAIWKALITLAANLGGGAADGARHVIAEIIDDHDGSGPT